LVFFGSGQAAIIPAVPGQTNVWLLRPAEAARIAPTGPGEWGRSVSAKLVLYHSLQHASLFIIDKTY